MLKTKKHMWHNNSQREKEEVYRPLQDRKAQQAGDRGSGIRKC